jgi:2-polyprenyl-6-methoxyphenol hydroxylase-like FAD-dependent oxidoreductase
MEQLKTTCCIAGGGPAGMMLGFLLARSGVDVVILEKHGDFLRDFRGDTVHPSTLELFSELGLLDQFLKLPHAEAVSFGGQFGSEFIKLADFSALPTHCKFIAFVPQWDLLNFLQQRGEHYPGFHLRMRAEVCELIDDGDRIVGVRAKTPEGKIEVQADLVVGCDGRHSTVRRLAGLEVDEFGAPLDVLWFRLPKRRDDSHQTMGRFLPGSAFVQIDRGDYWQCAYVIPKGGDSQVRAAGLPAFRDSVANAAPNLASYVDAIQSWDEVKLLTVQVDRLRQWHRDGLLCIGDAAHAMSPVGGVGINLAIQDAVAAANILAGPLWRGTATREDLAAVQKRREWPTKVTQGLQIQIQNRVISTALRAKGKLKPPFLIRLFNYIPFLRRIPARVIGLGVRPEHIQTPERVGINPEAKGNAAAFRSGRHEPPPNARPTAQ